MLFAAAVALGQGNLHRQKFLISNDTLRLDTLSLVPESTLIFLNGTSLPESEFTVNEALSLVIFKTMPGDTVTVYWRTFPADFSKEYAHKSKKVLQPDNKGVINPFSFSISDKNNDPFLTEGLNKSGSVSRGVSFGNNQNLAVNSSLNLQLSGKISDKLQVQASVTDDNIPIQPDGNTQQLQDFDQVYIKVFDDRSSLIAGDFWMKKPTGYFLNYNKRTQGASFSTRLGNETNGKGIYETKLSAAVSKGKFSRNVIQGLEGNQGPYKLRGAENETFIIVLAGTEQVYIDGQLLQRGQENDYVIDYNTSEITFTPNRLITKDRRIVVEFQYSDKNYARSIIESVNTFKKGNFKTWLNIYSEQDSKNQPLQQDLDANDKALLASVGDSIQDAFTMSIDSIGFDDNMVLYKMVDSLGYDSVLVFSTSSDSAFYRASFTYVGTGNGNYVQSDFTALGKTYKWVAPDTVGANIIMNGNYEPVILLVTPKKRQMVTAGAEYIFSKNTKATVEMAASGYDVNTFSSLHGSDDYGYGGRFTFESKSPLKSEKNDLKLTTNVQMETVSSEFTRIERFRAVEFERNWNILNRTITSDQYIGDAEVAIAKDRVGKFGIGANTFFAGNEYTGIINKVNGQLKHKGWNASLTGSYLNTKGFSKSQFLRHRSSLSKQFSFITLGFKDEHEYNRFYYQNSDSLLRNSYRFYDYEVYIQNADTNKNRYNLFYRQRNDWLADTNVLSTSALARHYGFSFDLVKNPKNMLRGKTAYRKLEIKDSTLTSQKPDETVVSRLEYDLKAFKSAVTVSTFYEIGTGQELKREFIYLEVPAGQGIYTWIDYNGNNVKELNEFEIAAFPDQATYIRSFTPTNEYVKTYTNQFSQSLNLNPSMIWKNKTGWRKKLSVFSNQTALRIDRKTNNEDVLDRYNPFTEKISDTSLISVNSSIRNTFFINRTGQKFGADYTYQKTQSKSLLTNGFDSRGNEFHLLKTRWNINTVFSWMTEAETGEKSNASDFLSGRNYSIRYYSVQPKFNIQPTTNFRISLTCEYTDKSNKTEWGGETAKILDAGTEIRYNMVNKGSILANFNFIRIDYTGATNSSLAFEMLNALKPGKNFTWTSTFQQNLSKNMQLNLVYNGRKSEDNKSIHTGSVQVRAFF
ncbi:MAG: hypothetical protein ACOZCO_16495 [Bacteroidota bacterium]